MSKYKFRQILHWFGIHWWSSTSSHLPYNIADADKKFEYSYQRYSSRRCWICNKEMPHSRDFFNIGVREKNQK